MAYEVFHARFSDPHPCSLLSFENTPPQIGPKALPNGR
jgi:hypothetical protein